MNDTPLANKIREMILAEELGPGERITEAALATRLGISRTPIRSILPRLAEEGLLEQVGRRGFAVRAFSEEECVQALELRAYLEAYAGRLLASVGASRDVTAALTECLEEGDKIFRKRHLEREDEDEYGAMNGRFHQIIVDACHSPMVKSMIERLNRVPFVAPSVIVFDQIGLRGAYELLFRAHGCHHAIVEAIRDRNGERVETLFREHANQQRHSLFARRARLHEELDDVGSIRKKKSRRPATV